MRGKHLNCRYHLPVQINQFQFRQLSILLCAIRWTWVQSLSEPNWPKVKLEQNQQKKNRWKNGKRSRINENKGNEGKKKTIIPLEWSSFRLILMEHFSFCSTLLRLLSGSDLFKAIISVVVVVVAMPKRVLIESAGLVADRYFDNWMAIDLVLVVIYGREVIQ